MLQVRDEDGSIIHLPAIKGKDGKSAYEYAIEGGFTGTEQEFIELLLNSSVIVKNHMTDSSAHTDIRQLIQELSNNLESTGFTIDSSLSTISTNPVQNKVITSALNEKATTTYVNTAIETAIGAAIAASY